MIGIRNGTGNKLMGRDDKADDSDDGVEPSNKKKDAIEKKKASALQKLKKKD